jgi:large subunit ribosomal protein L24
MQVEHIKIHKNDMVKVLSGRDRGKTGKVLKVLIDRNRALVEKVNVIKAHVKQTQKNPQGGIVEREASIAVSNLLVVCSSCNKPTRVGWKILENKKKVRVCKKCQVEIKVIK